MATRRDIDDFLAQKRIACVGVSRDSKQFANAVYSALKDRDYQVYPVNPKADTLAGDRCYPSVKALPQPVDGAMVMLKGEAALGVIRECDEAGINRVWLIKEAVTPEALSYCKDHGMTVVDGECPMMFATPVGFGHACHRFFKQITGTMPK